MTPFDAPQVSYVFANGWADVAEILERTKPFRALGCSQKRYGEKGDK